MNLEAFKSATLGNSYGNPRTNDYVGQCVSYARKYMEEVLGISTYANGHAKDYYDNQLSQNFDKVTSPQNGDIVVYGAVPGNPYGHIGIYYNGQLLSQNLGRPLYVTIDSLTLAKNRLGFLRKKGANMIDSTSTGLLRIGHSEIGGWNYEETHRGQHDQAFHAAWDGHSLDEFIWAQWNDGNAQIFRATRNEAMAKYPASAARIHDLEALNASQASTISAINSDNANKDQEIAKLKAELALAGSDTQQLNALGLALKWFIQRLGVK